MRPAPATAAFAALLLTILAGMVSPVVAQPVRTGHAEAELVSRAVSVAPGDSFRVALRLQPENGWYVYWSNPGDAGLPPTLDWNVPEGFSVAEMEFTAPERIEHPPFASFGYTSEVLYPLWIHASADLSPGTYTLRTHAEWLICKDECIPESADLALSAEVGENRADTSRKRVWSRMEERLPVEAPDWDWHAVYDENSLRIRWTPPAEQVGETRIAFFPLEQGIIENGSAQKFSMEGNRAILTLDRDPLMLAQPAVVKGVLTADPGWKLPDGRVVPALRVAASTEPPASAKDDFIRMLAVLSVFLGAVLVALLVLRGKKAERKQSP